MCHFWLQWPSLTLEGAKYGLLRFHFDENTTAENTKNTSNAAPLKLPGRHRARETIFNLFQMRDKESKRRFTMQQPANISNCMSVFLECSPANTKLSNAGDDAGSCSVQCHGVLPAAPGARCPPQCYSRCCGPQQPHSTSASESFDSPACYLRPLAVVHLLNPLTVPAS